MADHVAETVADWLNDATPADGPTPTDAWACVEIFGHRKHYGRVREVERFGAKLLRIDVPIAKAAPLLGETEQFETHLYGGGSIFSLTPMTEDAARKWATHERRYDEAPPAFARLPPPDYHGHDAPAEDDEPAF